MGWQSTIRRGKDAINALVERGLVPAEQSPSLHRVHSRFVFYTTEHLLGQMDPLDPQCPIRRQFVPDENELRPQIGELKDPIGDGAHEVTPGLIHRYPDRALLFLTHQCPTICRFCFRKVYLNDAPPAAFSKRLENALQYLDAHSEIDEVILSGGDPLMLGDRRLEEALDRISALPHSPRIRLHTKTLTALPQRFDDELFALLRRTRGITLIVHMNHPREWSEGASFVAKKLRESGVILLSQTVLLRNVNDAAHTLEELFRLFLRHGILPTYLHHPDQTVGTQDFRVSLEEGTRLYRSLRGRLSGHGIPTYVLDLPGGHGKIPVDSGFLIRGDRPGKWVWTSPFGGQGVYTDLAVSSPLLDTQKGPISIASAPRPRND